MHEVAAGMAPGDVASVDKHALLVDAVRVTHDERDVVAALNVVRQSADGAGFQIIQG